MIVPYADGAAPTRKGEIMDRIRKKGDALAEEMADKITEKIKFIGKVYVIPGENEMEALRDGVLMALDGKMPLHEYV